MLLHVEYVDWTVLSVELREKTCMRKRNTLLCAFRCKVKHTLFFMLKFYALVRVLFGMIMAF